jgi:hypothetical protein
MADATPMAACHCRVGQGVLVWARLMGANLPPGVHGQAPRLAWAKTCAAHIEPTKSKSLMKC